MASAAVANPLQSSSLFAAPPTSYAGTTTSTMQQHRQSSVTGAPVYMTASGPTFGGAPPMTGALPSNRPSQANISFPSSFQQQGAFQQPGTQFQSNYTTTTTTNAASPYPAAVITASYQQGASIPSYSQLPQQQTTLTRAAAPTTSYTTTQYPGQSVGTPQDSAIQNAIQQGKIYSPPGAIYVPGSAAVRAGIQTLYDAHLVPTFEATLTFPTNQGGGIYEPQQQISQVGQREAAQPQGVSYPHKASRVVIPQKRSACC